MAWQIPVPASDHELQNILSREQNADGIPTACSSMKDHGIIQGRPKVYAINRRSQVLPTNDFSDAWRDLNHAKTWKRARRSTTLQLLRFSCSRPMSPMPRPAKFPVPASAGPWSTWWLLLRLQSLLKLGL